MLEKYYQAKNWVITHPKKFYKYSMILILVSFLFTTLQYILFPPDFAPKFKVPSMYNKSDTYRTTQKARETEMGKIVSEMQEIQKKKETFGLENSDSLRLKYLYTEYQKLKNGHKKN